MFDRVDIEVIVGFVVIVWEMLKLQYEKLQIKKKVKFLAHEL
jgi:predicted metallopeptidase